MSYPEAAQALRCKGYTVSPVIGSAGKQITAHDGASAVTMTLDRVDQFPPRGVRVLTDGN